MVVEAREAVHDGLVLDVGVHLGALERVHRLVGEDLQGPHDLHGRHLAVGGLVHGEDAEQTLVLVHEGDEEHVHGVPVVRLLGEPSG